MTRFLKTLFGTRTAPTATATTRLRMETLEAREVCSAVPTAYRYGGNVYVDGTDSADAVTVNLIQQSNQPAKLKINITSPGQSKEFIFNRADIGYVHIETYGGGDYVCVNTTIRSEIHGGTGNDQLLGGGARDLIYGGDGHDDIHGYGGDNYIDGGSGNDNIFGGAGDDTLHGGSGNDDIYAYGGDNKLYGGPGDDFMIGGDGSDTMQGGAGNDTLDCLNGDDRIILYYWGTSPNGSQLLIVDWEDHYSGTGGYGFDTVEFTPTYWIIV